MGEQHSLILEEIKRQQRTSLKLITVIQQKIPGSNLTPATGALGATLEQKKGESSTLFFGKRFHNSHGQQGHNVSFR